jgi:hypothetical protein
MYSEMEETALRRKELRPTPRYYLHISLLFLRITIKMLKQERWYSRQFKHFQGITKIFCLRQYSISHTTRSFTTCIHHLILFYE